jgi:hypothetical protein
MWLDSLIKNGNKLLSGLLTVKISNQWHPTIVGHEHIITLTAERTIILKGGHYFRLLLQYHVVGSLVFLSH